MLHSRTSGFRVVLKPTDPQLRQQTGSPYDNAFSQEISPAATHLRTSLSERTLTVVCNFRFLETAKILLFISHLHHSNPLYWSCRFPTQSGVLGNVSKDIPSLQSDLFF